MHDLLVKIWVLGTFESSFQWINRVLNKGTDYVLRWTLDASYSVSHPPLSFNFQFWNLKSNANNLLSNL